ncbi:MULTISPECIES: chitinase, partial [unclassified Microcystis]|uniref:chitinase n=1 Tax=unclassified Microcystis TaxID=2643300 RepID=UPI0025904BD4
NAGAITLNSAKDIKVGDIFARSRDGEVTTTGVWNGGRVTLDAGGNIETGNITTTSITGNAGIVTLEADLGIKVGNVDTFTVNAGDAGNVRLTTLGFDSDITALAIKTNAFGNGEGGSVRITSGGNILVDSIRADSIGGIGGDIRLVASKTVRVTSSFSVNSEDYSIYTDSVDDASGIKGGKVTIEHGSKITDSLSPFIIGDASTNGTFAGVSDGTFGFVTTSGVHIFAGKSNFAGLHIRRADVVAQNFLPSWQQISGSERVLLDKFYPLLTYNAIFLAKPIDQLLGEYLSLGLSGFTLSQLTQIADITIVDNDGNKGQGQLNSSNAQKYLSAMNLALFAFGVTSAKEKAQFIAQSMQETQRFAKVTEDTTDNYIVEKNPVTSEPYPYNNSESYKGRGLLHLTYNYNYADFAKAFGLSVQKIIDNPNQVANDTVLAALSAMWFWAIQYADRGESIQMTARNNPSNLTTVDRISRLVQGGTDGVINRRNHFLEAAKVLKLQVE